MEKFRAIERIPNLCCSKTTAVADMKYLLIYHHEGEDGHHVRLRNRYGMSKWHSIFHGDCHTLDMPLEDKSKSKSKGKRFNRIDVDGSFSILAQVGELGVRE